ncbi:MAG: ATP-binding protein [Syntrophobacteraceae bacterium]
MKQVFLETQNVAKFREALWLLEDTERGQPGLGVVWGQAGRGKTVCAREYAVRTNAVYLRVMEDWTPRAMLASLCRELNGSDPRSTERCKKIACDELERQQRTVLVDEADRLPVGLVEHWRDIHDVAGVPVVLIGEEHLFPTLAARRRIWSRVTQTVEFKPIATEDIVLFGLKAADLRIDPEASRRIASRSGGDFRLVWTDIQGLEQMARAAGTKQVDLKMAEALPQRMLGPKPIRRGNGNS